MSEQNKAIVEKVNAALAQGNTEEFLSFCTDDVEWTMVGEKSVKGKNEIRRWMASMASENSNLPEFTVDNVIAEGDFVAARGDMTMKDKGGRPVPYSFCDIYRFRDGKIIELSSFVIKTEAKGKTSGAA
jgi:uncharacterized protein